MKHVVILNQFALPRTEGGGTRHIDLFGRLEHWQPLIVAGDRNHYSQSRYQTDDDRFRLVGLPRQSGGAVARLISWLVYGVKAFWVCLTSRRLDLVYGSSPQPLAALAGLIAARVRRRPFVLEVRDLWPQSAVSAGKLAPGGLTYRVFRFLEGVLARAASRVVCVTDGWQEHFAALGVPAERLVIIPNGTEIEDFAVGESRTELRRKYRLSGFTAVFAGAHGPKDGLDLILDSAERLPEVKFLLIGAGSEKEASRERAIRDDLTNVEFRDQIAKQDLAGLLVACDVGIHAVSPLSVFAKGMSPNKLFDYLAAGLPIVSNAGQGLRRITVDGECGRIGESEGLADCLSAVHDAEPEVRTNWSRRARELVQSRFSRSAAAKSLEAMLDSVALTDTDHADPSTELATSAGHR